MAANQTAKKPPTEIYRKEGRRWPALLILVVAALLVSSAVALGGRWVYREFVDDDSARTASPASTDSAPAAPETGQSQSSGESEASDDTESEQNGTNTNLPVTGG